MLVKIIGLPLAIFAFVAIASFGSYLVGHGAALFVGLAVGIGIWYFFHQIDAKRLWALLRPTPAIWQVPMPVAWGILRDVFDGSIVRTKDGAIAAWALKREDKSRGLLCAMLNILEHGGCGPNTSIEPRTIAVNAELKPHGSTTGVSLNFEIFSPTGTDLVEDIIRKCMKRLESEVKEYGEFGQTIEMAPTLYAEGEKGGKYV
ncbi:MAG: hypothetical protein K2X29_14570 [Candidatus Obscuribacterales bacterium]|nr:hypothetical protein [Candidatus Obscuribacterales bacterium]